MPGGHYVALSGMRTRLDELDRLAADIANVNTAGYKTTRATDAEADRPQFSAALQSAIDVSGGDTRLDTSAGAIKPTGRDTDFAIDGAGFFVVQTANGPRYTRNGHFSPRADGTLVTDDGDPVLGTAGPIKLGPGKVTVDDTGTIRAGDSVAGRLQIVDFATPGQLVQESGALLRADTVTPAPAPDAVVRGASLEQSNVSVVERMAELTGVSRSFEALQKALSVLMNDVDGRVIDQLGRR